MPAMKSIVALLLAAALLCGSSLASPCDLSCQSQPVNSLCGSASASHAAMSMNCEHCPGASSRNAPEDAASSTCGTTDCGPAVLLRAGVSEEALMALASSHFIPVAQVVLALPGSFATDGLRLHFLPTLSAFPPRLISLRV